MRGRKCHCRALNKTVYTVSGLETKEEHAEIIKNCPSHKPVFSGNGKEKYCGMCSERAELDDKGRLIVYEAAMKNLRSVRFEKNKMNYPTELPALSESLVTFFEKNGFVQVLSNCDRVRFERTDGMLAEIFVGHPETIRVGYYVCRANYPDLESFPFVSQVGHVYLMSDNSLLMHGTNNHGKISRDIKIVVKIDPVQ